ncbi:hypothetical protein GCM10010145_54630 [Streptomyces ruber]|uniref:DUF397 domain-containing protein n=2 Tax=Streptomyces TaxID=1883 RepID=A0A918BLJ6_9ACTN|nr:DUF397 domain-containing protein [Streptomyces ruber]GGQ77908.1 hypothetical protein GCM10010145_54630 [Streptomyces ruber]
MLAGAFAPTPWRKSSYSGVNEQNCCEIALLRHEAWIRDSKFPERTVLRVPSSAWRAAVAFFGEAQSPGGNHEQL